MKIIISCSLRVITFNEAEVMLVHGSVSTPNSVRTGLPLNTPLSSVCNPILPYVTSHHFKLLQPVAKPTPSLMSSMPATWAVRISFHLQSSGMSRYKYVTIPLWSV